jgi:hypothetical protein
VCPGPLHAWTHGAGPGLAGGGGGTASIQDPLKLPSAGHGRMATGLKQRAVSDVTM